MANNSKQHDFSGTHVFAEFYGVNIPLFNQNELENIISQACLAGDAHVIKQEAAEFANGGYTLFALLKESHLAIHTYPEHQSIFIDVFTCGKADSKKVVEKLAEYYQPSSLDLQTVKRGIRNEND
ncbi:adenosylmethionine decarboxylase [Enterococcus ureasiticus]|uniref:adenosylmethionine decarboxylase n=1 Tax=Enterococcus ureasiticus TaxID=903984 RepID=UPI001428CEE3|nr:adenosylmethionine decarboxylase [Enterococcus ureasiticus]